MRTIFSKSVFAFVFVAGAWNGVMSSALADVGSSQKVQTVSQVEGTNQVKTSTGNPQGVSGQQIAAYGNIEFSHPAKLGGQAETFCKLNIYSQELFNLFARIFLQLRGRDLIQLGKDVKKGGIKVFDQRFSYECSQVKNMQDKVAIAKQIKALTNLVNCLGKERANATVESSFDGPWEKISKLGNREFDRKAKNLILTFNIIIKWLKTIA